MADSDWDKFVLRAPAWMSTSQELRWVAKHLETGKFMVGMGREAAVVSALQLRLMSDEFYECHQLLDNFPQSEEHLTMQVMLLCFAADLIDDHCQCCGRAYQ